MAAMLKKQGYATAILGKWHLAGYPKDFTLSPMHPLECGFDYHYDTPGSNDVPAPPGSARPAVSLMPATRSPLKCHSSGGARSWRYPQIRSYSPNVILKKR